MDAVGELHQQLAEFDKFLVKALKTPKLLEENLSGIESRVAILTRGWRGSEEKSHARAYYHQTCYRIRVVFFALRKLKETTQEKQGITKEEWEVLEGFAKTSKSKQVLKNIQSWRKEQKIEHPQAFSIEYWDAVQNQLFTIFHTVVKHGIENRIKQEADEEADREMAKVKNPSWGLMMMAEGGGSGLFDED